MTSSTNIISIYEPQGTSPFASYKNKGNCGYMITLRLENEVLILPWLQLLLQLGQPFQLELGLQLQQRRNILALACKLGLGVGHKLGRACGKLGLGGIQLVCGKLGRVCGILGLGLACKLRLGLVCKRVLGLVCKLELGPFCMGLACILGKKLLLRI